MEGRVCGRAPVNALKRERLCVLNYCWLCGVAVSRLSTAQHDGVRVVVVGGWWVDWDDVTCNQSIAAHMSLYNKALQHMQGSVSGCFVTERLSNRQGSAAVLGVCERLMQENGSKTYHSTCHQPPNTSSTTKAKQFQITVDLARVPHSTIAHTLAAQPRPHTILPAIQHLHTPA